VSINAVSTPHSWLASWVPTNVARLRLPDHNGMSLHKVGLTTAAHWAFLVLQRTAPRVIHKGTRSSASPPFATFPLVRSCALFQQGYRSVETSQQSPPACAAQFAEGMAGAMSSQRQSSPDCIPKISEFQIRPIVLRRPYLRGCRLLGRCVVSGATLTRSCSPRGLLPDCVLTSSPPLKCAGGS